ncbi:MAG: hypothetical protein WDA59_00245 [Methanofastidiosum sp.]|jgi:hypothetical protein
MKHKFITPETCRCGKNGQCVVCDGGMQICSVCGLWGGSLTTDCPGEDSMDKSDDIYIGKYDYIEGKGWVELISKREVA